MTAVHKRHPDFLSDQRQFFDQLITDHWDSYASDEWDMARRFEVKKLFDRVQPGTVLDIGCGCGFHDVEMAQYDFVDRVDAIDYSDRSIEKANESFPHPKVRRWSADFSDLPQHPRYDLVVSFQVFEHLDDPRAYLDACRRLVSPSGTIAICTPNWNRLDNRVRRWRGMEETFVDPQHFNEYTPDSLKNLAAEHGLIQTTWFGYDITSLMLPRINRLSYNRRIMLGYRLPRLSRVFCSLFQLEATVEQ